MDRREFLVGAGAFLASRGRRGTRILLRSSWQSINIGDIAHTPGMLRLLERHRPDAEVVLWPGTLSDAVREFLQRRFPKLRLALTAEEQKRAVETCDVGLHGSGPGLVGRAAMYACREAGKPYGFGGVTLSDAELKEHRDLLSEARFVFCRDTDSLEALRTAGIRPGQAAFGPDATFAFDVRDDDRAAAFLKQQGLADGFACFVPRLRWTPYWKEGRRFDPKVVQEREAENERHREADHAKLRAAVVAWVRDGGRALLCPEMTYQVPLLKPLLHDPLPDDVRPHVVVRDAYWGPDEAAATYARAAAVVSLEMHSPILAVANGTPAIHVRQPTDTRKGRMWRDVGLGDWLFEADVATAEAIAERLMEIRRNPEAARATAARARETALAKAEAMIAPLG